MNLTKDRYFIDTSIIIYMFDHDNVKKKEKSVNIVKHALESGNGMISFQVIQEFCNAALKKFKVPMTSAHCKSFINDFLFPLCSVFPGIELYNKALHIHEASGYGFYDSLILSSCSISGCKTILSEDMQDNQVVEGIRIVDPFVEDCNI